ncbi:MAG: hypothetical protein HQL90_11385 [Magnetococcales bacterium]|nr:hypothetical protein [Magnetococcales bacterium]
MTTIARVVRNTPAPRLRDYFLWRGMDIGSIFNGGSDKRGHTATALLKVVERLDERDLAVLNADFDRIQEMADEAGQWAMLHVSADRKPLQELGSHYERALWLFMDDPALFRQAEEARFADTRRQGRMWSGFVGPRGVAVSQDPEDHRRFEEKVRLIFDTRNARLDLFDRLRVEAKEQLSRVVQAVIYREGLPDVQLVFNAIGDLELQTHRPVYEVSIVYEPASGIIEVVANGTENRARLARLFAEIILRQGILGMRVPLRQYDLSQLLQPYDFPSDPDDGIDAVKVLRLQLRRREAEQAHLALLAKWDKRETVYDYARQSLISADDLPNEYAVDEVLFSVRLRPTRRSSWRRRTINIAIALPNGCNLKSKTEQERMICDKYLPRWGLVKEV